MNDCLFAQRCPVCKGTRIDEDEATECAFCNGGRWPLPRREIAEPSLASVTKKRSLLDQPGVVGALYKSATGEILLYERTGVAGFTGTVKWYRLDTGG